MGASAEIRLRYFPIWRLVIAAALTLFDIAVIFFLVLRFVQTGGDTENLQITILFWMLMLGVGLSTWFYEDILSLFFPNVAEIFIDPKARFVELTRYWIRGKETDRYFFHQIEKIRSKKPKKNSKMYFSELILVNKKKIYIRIPIGDDKIEVTNFVKKINKIIRSEAAETPPM